MAETAELKEIARELRVDIIKMLNKSKSGHTGGSLSCIDILTTLYFSKMRLKCDDPKWPDRDRFVLSKGHAAPALYVVLTRLGYCCTEDLMTLRQVGSKLQGHPDCKSLAGVEVSTGSLGQGLSMANGIALAMRLDKSASRVYCLLGDGECQEGQVWEAAMAASHYKLDNLCAIIDNNGLQIDGAVKDIMGIEPLREKWKAFGWNVISANGHNFESLLSAFSSAEEAKGKPTMVIAETVKGKGVSIFEGKVKYHGTPPSDEELILALKELGEVV
ncbi:MAG: tklA [Deltaproteobacteria bacterium]|nr:tklA [Deltaproteobacteria bacterium]